MNKNKRLFIRDMPSKGVHSLSPEALLSAATDGDITAYCYCKPTQFTIVRQFLNSLNSADSGQWIQRWPDLHSSQYRIQGAALQQNNLANAESNNNEESDETIA